MKAPNIGYKVPDEVKHKIPDYFFFAMAGELVSVFGSSILELQTDSTQPYYDFNLGTAGWTVAFKAACTKLDMRWLINYYEGLDYYESDIFDAWVECEIAIKFCEHDRTQDHANPYYSHWLSKLIEMEGEYYERSQ